MVASLDARETKASPDAHVVLQTGRTIWDNLALLLVIDVVLALAAFPALVLAMSGFPFLALLLIVVGCGPVWAGSVATADQLNRDAQVLVKAFLGLVRRHAIAGIMVSLVPALIAAALLGTISLWDANPDGRWLIVPLLLDCSLAILVLISSVSAFSLATTSGLRGWDLWRTALAVAGASPAATVGSLALLVVLALVAGQTGFTLLFLIPAPIAVLFSAVTGSTVRRFASG